MHPIAADTGILLRVALYSFEQTVCTADSSKAQSKTGSGR